MTAAALNKYLRSIYFKRRLARGYANYEILSEAGLREAVAQAIRSKLRKLGTAKQYRVTCEVYLPGPNVRPDIFDLERQATTNLDRTERHENIRAGIRRT
jgi:hypothetical protein